MSTDLLADLGGEGLFDRICADDILSGLEEGAGELDEEKKEEKSKDEHKPSAEEEKSGEETNGGRSARGSVDFEVDRGHLDKMTGLNKFRDLEKRREEERKQHQKELEAEKAKKPYTGKKWGITTPAGPVRPQEAGSIVADAVRSNAAKLSAREEIEQQAKKAREKELLMHGGVPAVAAATELASEQVPNGEVTSEEQNAQGEEEVAEAAVAVATCAEASETKCEDGRSHGTVTQSTVSEHSEHEQEAKEDKDAPEEGVAVVAAVAVVESAGSAKPPRGSAVRSDLKAELQKIKHKMVGLFSCYHKKGAKEPGRPEESRVSIDAEPTGDGEAAGAEATSSHGDVAPADGEAGVGGKEQVREDEHGADQGKPENETAVEGETLGAGNENPPTTEEVTQPTAEEATQPTAEGATQPTAEEATQPTAEEANHPTVEEVTQPTAEEANHPTVEEATQPTAEEAKGA